LNIFIPIKYAPCLNAVNLTVEAVHSSERRETSTELHSITTQKFQMFTLIIVHSMATMELYFQLSAKDFRTLGNGHFII
jgi:hypothetical protein